MQQSETNTLAAALTTMMAGASVLNTLANSDIIEVRNSSGALKGKITAQNLAAFAAGSIGYIDSNSDLNSITNAGRYFINSTPTNAASNTRGVLFVFAYASYLMQVVVDSRGDVFHRWGTKVAPGSWKKVAGATT